MDDLVLPRCQQDVLGLFAYVSIVIYHMHVALLYHCEDVCCGDSMAELHVMNDEYTLQYSTD